MAEMRRFALMDGLLLIAVVAVAAGARAGYLITCADYARNDGPLRVETPPPDLDNLVKNLKNGWHFAVNTPLREESQETAWVAPGYPYATAAVGRLVDDAALPSTMRWIQCGLGALTAGLYFLFARRAFRSSIVAILAGLLCALHPFWILDTAALADGVMATFLLALVMFFGVRAGQTSCAISSLLYGLSLAVLTLVRAALLPFAFVALAWFLWRSRILPRGWLAALLALLGFVNGLAPWTVRNWQLFEKVVPIVESTYYHLWVGNKPPAIEEPDKADRADVDVPLAKLEQIGAEWQTLDGHYAHEIWRAMSTQPAETVRRRLRAGLDFVFGEHWFTKEQFAEPTGSEEIEPTWLAWTYPILLESTMLVLLTLGLLGWRWTYGWRTNAMPSSLAVMWIPLPYVLSHAEALSGPRLPLDGVLLCYTAFALACLLPGRRLLWKGEIASV